MAATTGIPMVMFGTKRPSMTSTWTTSAPADPIIASASPSFAKSAERMLGARTGIAGRRAMAPLCRNHGPSWDRYWKDLLGVVAEEIHPPEVVAGHANRGIDGIHDD